MPEHDILLRWLARAAGRTRVNERLQELMWLIIALLALAVAFQILSAGLRIADSANVLWPLFLVAGAVAIVYFVWRMVSGPGLTQAASRADAGAGLRNELRSALWFVSQQADDNFIRAHLARAAETVQRLDVTRLFPLVLPRNLSIAIALILFAGTMILVPPRFEPMADVITATPSAVSRGTASMSGEILPEDEDIEAFAAVRELSEGAWLKVEMLARELTAGPETQELAQAIAQRDVKTASRLLAGMRRKQAAQPGAGASARPQAEQMSAVLAQGILDRVQSLLNQGGGWSPQPDGAQEGSEQLTADLSRELREEMDGAQESLPGEMSPEEEVLNTSLLAMSRDSTGGREIVRGESPPMQSAGRTSVGSGAMGRRIGMSTGGAGEGEQPRGNPDGNAEAQPVLGRKTMRLRMQMQTVKIDSVDTEDDDGTEESFYAATQAQAAKTQYETVTAQQSGGAEQVGGAQQLPLVYRDAVKRYTLRQHQREMQLSAQERAAR